MAQLSTLSLVNDAALRAYYKFEADGGDSKGSNNLTNNNSIAFNPAEYGNGADTGANNTNKYFSTNNLWFSYSELAASWSIGFKLKMNALPSSSVALVMEDAFNGSNNRNFTIWIDNNGYISFSGYPNASGSSFLAKNPNPIVIGVSHSVAVTWTAGLQELWIDGVRVAFDTASWGSDPNDYHNNYQSRIFTSTGSGGSYEFASALADDLCFFTKGLSSSEISSLAVNISPSSSISPSLSPSASQSPSASASPSASVSPSISPSASRSPSSSNSPSNSISASPSPSMPLSLFTRQSSASLPTTKADLATNYTPADETKIATDDGVRVDMEGTPPGYLIHQFKVRNSNNHDAINIEVITQTTLSCSIQPVYLQIWNTNTKAWEIIATDSESVADANFQLTGIVSSNLSNYYDELADLHFPTTIYQTHEVAVRIYQHNL